MRSSPVCLLAYYRILPVKSRSLSVLAQKTQEGTDTKSVKQQVTAQPRLNPAALVAPELSHIRRNLLSLLGAAHIGLRNVAEYHFKHSSRQLRSLLVLLLARATNGLGQNWELKKWNAASACRLPRTSMEHPNFPTSVSQVSIPSSIASPSILLPTQIRLAHIVEMIHVASVLHNGIMNKLHFPVSPHNSGFSSFENKLSILGGDFLLGRASIALSYLGESEVVELVATVISNNVEGEVLKIVGLKTPEMGTMNETKSLQAAWDLYLRQTYLTTASLFAKSSRAAVVLGGAMEGDMSKEVAYIFGRNLGFAYRLVEDAAAYEKVPSSLNIADGPMLYASEEHPLLRTLIQRNFVKDGDVEVAVDCVLKSSGVERTRLLANTYASKALEILQPLPASDAKAALEALVDIVVKRTW